MTDPKDVKGVKEVKTSRVSRRGAACLLALFTSLTLFTSLPRAQQVPQFRAGIDISRTTVRVLDSNRKPVRGLTEADFTVLVNGVKQQIVTVVAADEAGPVTPTASWMRDIAPDVASNDLRDPRLVVIIMDDVTPMEIPLDRSKASPYQVAQARLVARTIIDELGPNDLASIVYSGDNRGPQDFTQDRARLLAAVDRYHVTELKAFTAREYTRNVIQMSLEFLRQVPERRSVILWISDTFPGADDNLLPLAARLTTPTSKTAERLEGGAANVPVFSISTRGFTGGAVPADSRLAGAASRSRDDERTIAGRTGGRTIAQTNTPAAEIPAVFRELSVAYTIGFQQDKPETDGRFRRVEVRVNRPDVIIEPSEHGYFPTSASARRRLPRRQRTPSLRRSRCRALCRCPTSRCGWPLRRSPMAMEQTDRLRAWPWPLVWICRSKAASPDTVDLEIRIFDAEGRKQVEERRDTQLIRPRGGRAQQEFDLFSTFLLKPGRYNIRASMYSTLRDSAGSVYTDFVVPDFGKAPLALSGLVIATVPEKPSMPAGEFRSWLPVVPTTTRSFAASDGATAFLRVYSGDAGLSPSRDPRRNPRRSRCGRLHQVRHADAGGRDDGQWHGLPCGYSAEHTWAGRILAVDRGDGSGGESGDA